MAWWMVDAIMSNPNARDAAGMRLIDSPLLTAEHWAHMILDQRIVPPRRMINPLIQWAIHDARQGQSKYKIVIAFLLKRHLLMQKDIRHIQALFADTQSRTFKIWFARELTRASRPRKVPRRRDHRRVQPRVPRKRPSCEMFAVEEYRRRDFARALPQPFVTIVNAVSNNLASENACSHLMRGYTKQLMRQSNAEAGDQYYFVLEGRGPDMHPHMPPVAVAASLCTVRTHDIHIETICATQACGRAGATLLRHIENKARELKKSYVTLNSLDEAHDFYIKQKYLIGDPVRQFFYKTSQARNGSVHVIQATRASFRIKNSLKAARGDTLLPFYKEIRPR